MCFVQQDANILVECGFMDDLEEAANVKWKTSMNCGVAKGICEYFGVAYVPPSKRGGITNGED